MPIRKVDPSRAHKEEGLPALFDCLWRESGREGARPASWRPSSATGGAMYLVEDGEQVLGFAHVRPAEGMGTVDVLYVRPHERRVELCADLLDAVVGYLKAHGKNRIAYVSYGYWRSSVFPIDLETPFGLRSFSRLEGVFLAYTYQPNLDVALPPVPAGYHIEPFDEARLEETCMMMLRSPEPKAIYWDWGLCWRSIMGAAAPNKPWFPDGLGLIATHNGAIVSFSLATIHGYINHVYTAPEHRGRSLGSALLMRVTEAVRKRGLTRATIMTHHTNPDAIRLYQRRGFVPDFTYPQFYTKW